MGKVWPALPLLAATLACSPVGNIRNAARNLTVTVDRVEPSLRLDFPLDRSTLNLRVTCTVDNPSQVPFHLRAFQGRVGLDSGGQAFTLGQVNLAAPVDLPGPGRATVTMEVAFAYSDLRDHWPALQATLGPGAAGAWTLEGRISAEAYGIAWPLPVKTRQTFGARP